MDCPDPGVELGSPALQADSLPTELSGKPLDYMTLNSTISVHIRDTQQEGRTDGGRLRVMQPVATGCPET